VCILLGVICVDFFDSPAAAAAESELESSSSTQVIAEQLPEGFFDDPKLDAKVL